MSLSSMGSFVCCLPTLHKGTILQMTIKVFDETHDPGYPNSAFNHEFTTCFHLLMRPRTTPWSHVRKACYNDDFIEVNETT